MISRGHIETILKINGVAPSSPDEQIRSVLLSARYSKDEVDTALMVLRENTVTKQSRVDGLHKVFRTSEALRPEEISDLLGIDVSIENPIVTKKKQETLSFLHYATIWLLSVIVAVSGILFYMYLHQVGLFHSSVQLTKSR